MLEEQYNHFVTNMTMGSALLVDTIKALKDVQSIYQQLDIESKPGWEMGSQLLANHKQDLNSIEALIDIHLKMHTHDLVKTEQKFKSEELLRLEANQLGISPAEYLKRTEQQYQELYATKKQLDEEDAKSEAVKRERRKEREEAIEDFQSKRAKSQLSKENVEENVEQEEEATFTEEQLAAKAKEYEKQIEQTYPKSFQQEEEKMTEAELEEKAEAFRKNMESSYPKPFGQKENLEPEEPKTKKSTFEYPKSFGQKEYFEPGKTKAKAESSQSKQNKEIEKGLHKKEEAELKQEKRNMAMIEKSNQAMVTELEKIRFEEICTNELEIKKHNSNDCECCLRNSERVYVALRTFMMNPANKDLIQSTPWDLFADRTKKIETTNDLQRRHKLFVIAWRSIHQEQYWTQTTWPRADRIFQGKMTSGACNNCKEQINPGYKSRSTLQPSFSQPPPKPQQTPPPPQESYFSKRNVNPNINPNTGPSYAQPPPSASKPKQKPWYSFGGKYF